MPSVVAKAWYTTHNNEPQSYSYIICTQDVEDSLHHLFLLCSFFTTILGYFTTADHSNLPSLPSPGGLETEAASAFLHVSYHAHSLEHLDN
jgi:hypothetical protein